MMFRIYFILILLLVTQSLSQKNLSPNGHLEIIPQHKSKALFKNSKANIHQYPSVIKDISFQSNFSSPLDIAIDYLKTKGGKFGISDVDNTLQFKSSRETLSGHKIRFQQIYNGYPVYKATVVVSINKNNQVVFVANGYKPNIQKSFSPIISKSQSVAISTNHLQLNEQVKNLKTDVAVFEFDGRARLVNVVSFIPVSKNRGDWEFLIDAETGEIIQAKDNACYFQGNVFDPDPITRSGAVYGDPGFIDNNDLDSDQLTAQLIPVEFPELFDSAGIYKLESTFAKIVDLEAPYSGLYTQDSMSFSFTRSDSAFEAANAFYHIDKSMRYINDTLGLALMPYQYEGGVKFDPHGLSGSDDSYYVLSQGYLAFGDGGVDDAEDPDVIIHELCHGIHDWITDGSLSNIEGLSEGSSDYWAQSYKRSTGFLSEADTSYNWIYSWDGHNNFWQGRTTGYEGIYPDDLSGEIHIDGQIWSSTLMEIYDQIGKNATDIIFLETLSMLNGSSNQRDAVFAFIQADIEMFAGSHLDVIEEVFTNRGYISGSLVAEFKADVTAGQGPLSVQFFSEAYSFPDSIDSLQWDFQNDGVIDSYEKNPTFNYTQPGLYTVSLTVSNGTEAVTDSLIDYISVNSGIFIWDGLKNHRDNSGSYIFKFLNSLSIGSVYSYSENLPTSFVGYSAVFLSYGNGGNSVYMSDEMAQSIKEYLSARGNLFIEGGDIFSDHEGDSEFLKLLGISNVFDGDENQLSNLAGQSTGIFDGMVFTSSSQQQYFSIDRLDPLQNGVAAFVEDGYINVAAQSEGDSLQKAIAFSYAMSELVDNQLPSTRDDFIFRILKYFEIPVPLTPRFSSDPKTGHAVLTTNFSEYSFYNTSAIAYKWDFENDGVVDSEEQNPQFTFNDPGYYNVKLTVDDGINSADSVNKEFIKVFDGESALNFTVDENYVIINPDSLLNIENNFTLEFWMNPTGWGPFLEGYGKIFDKQSMQIYLIKEGVTNTNDNSLQLLLRNQEGTNCTYSTPDSSIKLNEWQHVAIIFNSSESKLSVFINGIEADLTIVTTPFSGSINDNTNVPIYFGDSDLLDRPFVGTLDEIRLWNISVSTEQVQNNMLKYVNPGATGLVGYWNCNEGSGASLSDLTGHGFDGYIINPDWVQGRPNMLPASIKKPTDNLVVNNFKLYSNFPNPFNPVTMIKYQIPVKGHVRIKIFNVLGQLVKKLIDRPMNRGVHKFTFNATGFASGVYIYQLEVNDASGVLFKEQKKMVLIR